jgi:hypothetical protein
MAAARAKAVADRHAGAALRVGVQSVAEFSTGTSSAPSVAVPQGCRPGFSTGATVTDGTAQAVWPVSIMGEPAELRLALSCDDVPYRTTPARSATYQHTYTAWQPDSQ